MSKNISITAKTILMVATIAALASADEIQPGQLRRWEKAIADWAASKSEPHEILSSPATD